MGQITPFPSNPGRRNFLSTEFEPWPQQQDGKKTQDRLNRKGRGVSILVYNDTVPGLKCPRLYQNTENRTYCKEVKDKVNIQQQHMNTPGKEAEN